MYEIMTADEAIRLIRDGDCICVNSLKVQKTRQTCSHYLQEGLELCQNEHLLPERRI